MIKYILPVIALAFASSAYAHCGTCGVGGDDHKHDDKAKVEAKADCCTKEGATCCKKEDGKEKAACCKDGVKCEKCEKKAEKKVEEKKAEEKKAE